MISWNLSCKWDSNISNNNLECLVLMIFCCASHDILEHPAPKVFWCEHVASSWFCSWLPFCKNHHHLWWHHSFTLWKASIQIHGNAFLWFFWIWWQYHPNLSSQWTLCYNTLTKKIAHLYVHLDWPIKHSSMAILMVVSPWCQT